MVSVNNTGDGQGGNGSSGGVFDLSANGRYVAFPSVASNLVSGDTNGKRDIFVRDLDSDTTVKASISASGVQANSDPSLTTNGGVAISESGRYVVFASTASNLIDGQTIPSTYPQIYIRDMVANTIEIVTQKPDGTLSNAPNAEVRTVSNDGRFVVWQGRKSASLNPGGSTVTTINHLYLADRQEDTFTLLSPEDGSSDGANTVGFDSSCNGSLIAFSSSAQHDIADTDAAADIYIADIRNGLKIKNITSSSSMDAYHPSISCNGNFITFISKDTVYSSVVPSGNTKQHLYLYDRINETFSIVDTTTSGTLGNNDTPAYSGVDNQGNVVFSSQSTNFGAYPAQPQVYLKHKQSGTLEIVSRTMFDSAVASNGVLSSVHISSDGKRAVYTTGNPANSVYAPVITNWGSYDNNGYGDIAMSLTGL